MRLGAGADSKRLHVSRTESARQRKIGLGSAPFDSRLDDDCVVLDRGRGSRERQVLGGVVAGVGTEECDEVAEAFDERAMGIQSEVLEVKVGC